MLNYSVQHLDMFNKLMTSQHYIIYAKNKRHISTIPLDTHLKKKYIFFFVKPQGKQE